MWAVWQNGLEVLVYVLALRKLCVLIGIDCMWASGGHPVASRHLIENGCPRGTGWCSFGRGLAPPFQLGFRSIEDIK